MALYLFCMLSVTCKRNDKHMMRVICCVETFENTDKYRMVFPCQRLATKLTVMKRQELGKKLKDLR